MSLTIDRTPALHGADPLPFKSWDFPDGAVGFRLEGYSDPDYPASIIARIQSSRDFVELIMAVDALREANAPAPYLVLPCVPNQRQDRACVKGEPVGILAFARQIAALGIKRVTMFDPHSDVTPAVFKALGMSVTVYSQAAIIGRFDALNKRLTQPGAVFVSPDAGANKKTSDLAGIYGHSSFIRADKLRDLATGKIKEIVVVNPREEVEGRDCIIVDDLCDAGGTFVGLAAALKAKGARRVELYVTHGLFTKGVGLLFAGGIDHVWTTTSFQTGPFWYKLPDEVDAGEHVTSARFTALNLEEVFSL